MTARPRTSGPRAVAHLLAGALAWSACTACSGGAGEDVPGESDERGASSGPPAWFEERAREHGLDFEHRSGHDGEHYMPEIMGGGAALFDMDGDGDLDAYLVQSGALDAIGTEVCANRLYENDGSGRFRDVTAGSGAGDTQYGMGIACGDVDGDGDTDLYVTNVGPNTLLLNEGGGRFRDATLASGAGDPGWGASATFFDADADGHLDVFVTNYLDWSQETELPCMDSLSRPDYCSPKNYKTPAIDVFLHNRGDGTFEDLTLASGVRAVPGNGLGVGCADFDGNGYVDVFVANDGMPDVLWMNRGDLTFEDQAAEWGCATDLDGLEKAGMGVALGDIDGDLDVDLMVCNLSGESDSIFRNEGSYWADHTVRAGLAAASKSFTRFGMGWVDFDNDGALDLYQANGRVARAREGVATDDPYAEPNLLFRGAPEGAFTEVEPRGGTRELLSFTSRAAAFGDVDGDGAIDVLVVNRDAPAHLLMNTLRARASAPANWIALDVRDRTGGHALGATLTIEVGEARVRRDVRAGFGYLASHDPRVHVGLGAEPRVDAVHVRWPDGEETSAGPLDAGSVHVITR